ncbi:MAG: NUDIX domain-containing protein [Acidobacteriota bacterium]|nr:NUDIX domain-containing protein [Acidobacteriota bacterium]
MTKSSKPYAVEEPPVTHILEPLSEGDAPYRDNVAALVVRPVKDSHEIVLGERTDSPGYWQWPQGGMEPGEDHLTTLRRELAEEIGLHRYRVLYQFPFRLRYRFPQAYVNRLGRPYRGQEQTFFIVEALEEPDLGRAGEEEFRDMAWFPVEDAGNHAIWFKAPLYRRALAHAREILPTLPWD